MRGVTTCVVLRGLIILLYGEGVEWFRPKRARKPGKKIQVTMKNTSITEWNRNPGHRMAADRHPLIRPVTYERCSVIGGEGLPERDPTAVIVNISNEGMCVLVSTEPAIQEVMRVQMPTPAAQAKAPTLAEVRWVRGVTVGGNDLFFAGLKFLL